MKSGIHFGEILYHKIRKTRGARFRAHSNLLEQCKLSYLTIGMLSAYVLILNLLVYSNKLRVDLTSEDLNIITMALTIMIIVFSQAEASKDYKLRALKLHDSAKEMGPLYNKLTRIIYSETIPTEQKEAEYQAISDQYDLLLVKYDENHEPRDYQQFRADNPAEFKLTKLQVIFMRLYVYIQVRLLYFSLIFVPPVAFYFWVK